MQYQNFEVLTHDLYKGLSLVEASAGTGKTYSITWIVVRLLISGIKIEEILLTTFTLEATKELKERIIHLLRQISDVWLDQSHWSDEIRTIYTQLSIEKNALNHTNSISYDTNSSFWMIALERINEAILTIDDALITTIHGFCSQMLKDYSLEAGFEFPKIEMDLSGLYKEIVDDYQSYIYSEGNLFALMLFNDTDEKKTSFLLGLVKKLQETIWEDIWFDPMDQSLEVFLPKQSQHHHPKDVLFFWDHLMEDLSNRAKVILDSFINQEDVDHLQEDIKILEMEFGFNLNFCEDVLQNALPLLRNIFKETNVDEKFKFFLSHLNELKKLGAKNIISMVSGRVRKKKPSIQNQTADHLDLLSNIIENYQKNIMIYYKKCFVNYAKNALNQRKKEKNIIGISDLIFLTYEAIYSSDQTFLKSIQSRIKSVLIDEFQDTDPIQWGIFGKIVENGEIITYLIGDPKQSIYRFRGADLNAYLLVKDSIQPSRCFTMSKNFRSDPKLLSTLNYLFDPEQKGAAAGTSSQNQGFFNNTKIPYIHVEGGKKDRYADKAVKFVLLNNKNSVSFKTELDYIAGEVKKYLDENHEILDSNQPRLQRFVKKSDIGILVRSNKKATEIAKFLAKRGIPSTLHTTESVFKTNTAKSMELILQAILMPSHMASVKSAICSDFFNLNAITIKDQWENYKPTFIKLHDIWINQGVAVALNALLIDDHINLINLILAQINGPQTLTNYMHLIELLQTASLNQHLTPELTLNWLRVKRLENLGDNGTQLDEEQIRPYLEEDSVQILTIHKSKGLEYPILFCAEVAYSVNPKKSSTSPEALKEIDSLVRGKKKILDLRRDRIANANHVLPIEMVEKQIFESTIQENRRLLYVTLTRAVHHCRIFIKRPSQAFETSTIFNLIVKNVTTEVKGENFGQLIYDVLKPLINDSTLSLDVELASDHIDQSRMIKQGIATKYLAMQSHPKPSNPHFLKTSFTTLASLLKQEASDVSLLISEDIPETNADIIYQQGLIDQQQNLLSQIQELKLQHVHSSFRSVTSIRGASLGNLVHLIFEKIDYQKTSEAELFPQIKNLLKIEAQSLSETEQKNICAAILQVLTTPLGTITNDLMLSDLSFLDRSNEMQFEIKIPDGQCVTAEHLNHLLSIGFENDSFFNAQNSGKFALFPKDFKFTGLIKGVIDLCFKNPSSDQFFVVDFKSNYLDFFKGSPYASQIPTIINYHPSLLKDAMIDQLYFLQVLIYLLALHRLLKHALGNRYIPQDHIGGIMFLFVRGMVGVKSRIDPNTVLGIFEYKPSLACIQAIDLLFENPKAYEQQYMNQISKG